MVQLVVAAWLQGLVGDGRLASLASLVPWLAVTARLGLRLVLLLAVLLALLLGVRLADRLGARLGLT